MRLLDCQLQNVRLHGDLSVAFSPRLTLIGGANETGKSTLVEALHRALFLRAAASGGPVEALRSRLHLGHPTVTLRFEAQEDTWTLRKRFSGSTGQVSLRRESGGQPLSGPAAEELLAALVGVGETLDSRQARSALPGRWAHLWVMQGSGGADPLAAGGAGYDLDTLLNQLEEGGGAAVQQSLLDQRVAQRLAAALDENFTSRGVKKNSPLGQRQDGRLAARLRLDQALARLEEYEKAGEELAAVSETLERLQNEELPALLERRQRIQQGAEAATRLDGAIQLAGQALDPIRLRHEAARRTLADSDGLTAEIDDRRKRLEELRQRQAGAQERDQALRADVSQRIQARDNLQQQRSSLEQRNELLQTLLERSRQREALERLKADREQRQRHREQRQELERELAGLPALSRRDLQQLRELQQRSRDLQTQREAMAASVKLLSADQPVRLDGEPLQAGEQRRLSTVFELQVGDGVRLEIRPGGGQALGELEQQAQASARALQERLDALAVASLEAAEQRLEQRSALEQKLAALPPAAETDPAALEPRIEELQQRCDDLERQLERLADCRRQLEPEQPLPETAEALQALQQELARTLAHTTTALRQAESEREKADESLRRFLQAGLDDAGQLQVLEAELSDRRQRLAALEQEHGPRQALAERLAALGQERERAEAELERLRGERAALGEADPAQELARLEKQREGLQERVDQEIDRRGAAKQRCDAISESDPYAAVERERVQLETAEADLASLQRLVAAQRELLGLFQQAQADLSSRYSEPLAQAIGSYLRPLVPEGPVVQLGYEQGKGFRGLQLRRGPEYYDFGELSGGMREQLAAALRLSMADVLRGAHDGCLPLLFDDAFTNSDPERIDLVKTMLGTAVERGLQVILLTCDPAAYRGFADQTVELGG